MKIRSVDTAKIICENPDSPFGYFGWPSVTRLPDGTLAAVCSGYRLKHICPFGKAVIQYSRDEGRSWTRPAAVIDTPLDDRDAGITVFGNGRVILTSFNNSTAQQREWNKTTEGFHKPESEVQRALINAYLDAVEPLHPETAYLGSTYRISDDGGYTFGSLHRSPVTAPHGPISKKDGTLFYVGTRFNYDPAIKSDKTALECYLLGADDQFEFVSSIPDIEDEYGPVSPCEPHAIELPNGSIIVHIRAERSGEHPVFTLYQSESLDGGHTFSQPHRLLSPCGGAPAHLLLHSSGILISAYGYRQSPFGIRVMFSCDFGNTWETDIILTDDALNPDLGYPATVELKDGSLLTVWYQNCGGRAVLMQKKWEISK